MQSARFWFRVSDPCDNCETWRGEHDNPSYFFFAKGNLHLPAQRQRRYHVTFAVCPFTNA
jgi:hypothetical protein